MPNYIIIRTSWLFGPGGKNFVSTIAQLAKEKETIEVVCDQKGSPTYTLDLARAISDIIDVYFVKGVTPGIYNITNSGFCSWAELADYTIKTAGLKASVIKINSDKLERKAKRPRTPLSKKNLNLKGYDLPGWQEA